jgi:hypothetical protein
VKGGGQLLWLVSSATITVIQNMPVHQIHQFLRVWNATGDAGNAALEMAALHLSMFMYFAYCYKNTSLFLKGLQLSAIHTHVRAHAGMHAHVRVHTHTCVCVCVCVVA